MFDVAKNKLFREFAWLTAASARSGVHRPNQVLALTEEVGRCELGGERDRFTGRLLDLRTLPRIQCLHEYIPSATDASCGPLHMLSADAFAGHLLSAFDEVGLKPGQVVINKLDFRDLSPRRVCINWRFSWV